jgi:hypothetical protein
MSVPRCKECDLAYKAWGKYHRKSPRYCKPEVNEFALSRMRFIPSIEIRKTSPKWCPKRLEIQKEESNA